MLAPNILDSHPLTIKSHYISKTRSRLNASLQRVAHKLKLFRHHEKLFRSPLNQEVVKLNHFSVPKNDTNFFTAVLFSKILRYFFPLRCIPTMKFLNVRNSVRMSTPINKQPNENILNSRRKKKNEITVSSKGIPKRSLAAWIIYRQLFIHFTVDDDN